jgi:hypothetical protein
MLLKNLKIGKKTLSRLKGTTFIHTTNLVSLALKKCGKQKIQALRGI